MSEEVERKSAFAARLGLTRGRVSQMVAAGLPVTDSGFVPVQRALAWVEANINTTGDSDDLATARLRLLNAQAALAELEARKRRCEVVDREEARRAARAFGRALRDIILAFPNRYGAGIAAELKVDPATLMAALESRLREMLLEGLAVPAPYHRPTEPPVMGGEAGDGE